MNGLIVKPYTAWKPERSELADLLRMEDFSKYYRLADEVTRMHHGDTVCLRAIIEFSNYCIRECKYCGLNVHNRRLIRYRMEDEEIESLAKAAYEAGYMTVVLQAGEDPEFTAKRIAQIVCNAKSQIGDESFAVTISAGEMSREDYRLLRDAGADRYLLKHEICDPEIYERLHPNASLHERKRCLEDLKDLGFETGSGFMIGLPEQTVETIADDLLLLQSIPCDMAGIGPFVPHPDTSLAGVRIGESELVKRSVALARLMLPEANLPATTALEVADEKARYEIFSCGANVIMRTVTPQKYRENYSIYPSDITVNDIKKDRIRIERAIKSIGKISV